MENLAVEKTWSNKSNKSWIRRKRPYSSRASNVFETIPSVPCLGVGASVNNKNQLPEQMELQVLANHNSAFSLSNVTSNTELHSGSKNQRLMDDDDGHLNFNVGDVIIERYKLMGFLGKGSFGRVVKAFDMQEVRHVALKIVKNDESCRESGQLEIQLMKRLTAIDPSGFYLWVRMLDYFEVSGHICIAFEKLGDDIYTFLRENKHQPYQMSHVRHIAYQIIHSVKALHDHSIIHSDLKPENICFQNSEFTYGIRSLRHKTFRKVIDSTIRLIDFGSAIHSSDDYQGIIQTRSYRCPEVIFGLGFSNPCDVWSIGCILFELYSGSCLFSVNDNVEHVNTMRDILGPLPDMYKDTSLGRQTWEDYVPLPQRKSKTGCKPLRKSMSNSSLDHCQLFDLIEEMLQYDPLDRINLAEALEHPFFNLLPNNLKCG